MYQVYDYDAYSYTWMVFSVSGYIAGICSAWRSPAQWHDIVLLLSTWYNIAACVIVL